MLPLIAGKLLVERSSDGDVKVKAGQDLRAREIALAPSVPSLAFIVEKPKTKPPPLAVGLNFGGTDMVILPYTKFPPKGALVSALAGDDLNKNLHQPVLAHAPVTDK